MNEVERFRSLRPSWLHRVVQTLARGSGVRQDIRAQLERFFDLLVEVIDTGDAHWLDPVVADWSSALTVTDLQDSNSTVTTFLKEIMTLTLTVCFEQLSADEATDLQPPLIAAFAHSFEQAAECEIRTRVAYATGELDAVRQNLEKLDRSKSDFIAVAAHELKTPLTLIEGYTAMLRDSLQQAGPDENKAQLLNGINHGTQRLRVIIDDMIDVSLIDNNLLSLNFQPMWLNRLLASLTAELDDAIQERRLIVNIAEFEVASQLMFGDPERLRQALRNVITNAIKFTPDGGRIEISGRKLPGFVEICVTDTGIGIDPDDVPTIFEKFSRLGNSALHSSGKTKFKGGGPGLGLHIARGILEAHGGTIWAESPGYDERACPGSTFHILLPLREEPPDTNAAKLFAPLIQSKPFTQP
jgi:signal transduction histidine kinase